ncbi:sulfatase-like hydrolase/transferase [Haloferula sp. BvORR071]|uniref:sulfatase-like hydrolase/transferase n=1 Tax=Haloferula sp. BvORR071 TaxID=1396141 RepID=UPI0009DFAD53|nr:sulfatase-like hydrolase/transferase [Haloferula sp. BvORR071]
MQRTYSFAFSLILLAVAHAERKPNILIIVADDLGYGELSSQGFTKEIPTPHIDSIAANGIRFTSGYVSGPYCSPTRAGLLTGRYQERFGHEFNPGLPADPSKPMGLPVSETTIGDRFKAAGYATGWFGKSHLGVAPEFHPLKRGFDEFFGFLAPGSHDYLTAGKGQNALLRGTEPVPFSGYLTETLASEAISFIERKKDQPWMVYLPFNAVHSPLEATAKYEERFTSITDPKRRKFAAMLSAMDDAVGNVLAKLRELNLEEDTLVFFFSDNGGPTDSTTSRNGPLRGYKAFTSEGGIRIPFMVQWKGKLPAAKVDDRPVIQLDILPTSLAAAGVEVDQAWKLDGVNLLPYLKGENQAAPHEALYWRFGQQLAIRKGDWKLVKSAADGVIERAEPGTATVAGAKLYNLSKDIGESSDLAAANPLKVAELSADWNAWNATLVAPLWTPPGFHPQGGRIKGKQNTEEETEKVLVSAKGPWQSGDALSGERSPRIAGKAFEVSARIEPEGLAQGVIIALGGASRGFALHVASGKLVFSLREDGEVSNIASTAVLSAGPHQVEASLDAQGAVTLKADGAVVGEGKLKGLLKRQPAAGLSVGSDTGSPVGDYPEGNPFKGKVSDVSLEIAE